MIDRWFPRGSKKKPFRGWTRIRIDYHRYYDPNTGRYLRTDPLGDGLNLYIYCFNNPHYWIDPLGLCAARNVVTITNILDVLPVGMIPVVGQIVGEILDVAAFVGSEYVLLYDFGKGNISISEFWAGTGLNIANLALGSL
ncbi:MAG: RHS repeat-associated core domain-containing protein, partial [Thermodesulfobacteriota bacterium]|nr:RHS repeat-associated core domain-containing protein [Thermodesulfobacteriota bacterium]